MVGKYSFSDIFKGISTPWDFSAGCNLFYVLYAVALTFTGRLSQISLNQPLRLGALPGVLPGRVRSGWVKISESKGEVDPSRQRLTVEVHP